MDAEATRRARPGALAPVTRRPRMASVCWPHRAAAGSPGGSPNSTPEKSLGDAAIELEKVSLARGGRTVLADVSATIRPGEFIGVFGPNGAGKTTLLQAILGLLRPTSGAIRVFGAALGRGNRTAGYLPQQRRSMVADLPLRGWDFVASAFNGERWGLPRLGRAGQASVAAAIATVGAEALAGRRLCDLSGGELQRLLLAQALLGAPRILLLDEPLISLDPRFQQAVVSLVKKIQMARGITVMFTAHDLNPLLPAMDRVLYLGHGRAVLGTLDAVIRDDILSALYDMPIEVLRLGGRILVAAGHGAVEAEAHRHDAPGYEAPRRGA
jgi:zinc/manganese transport system ATP-binding protein